MKMLVKSIFLSSTTWVHDSQPSPGETVTVVATCRGVESHIDRNERPPLGTLK